MAVLTSAQRDALRQQFEQALPEHPARKANLDAAFQAVEDTFESSRAGLGAAIDAATAPVVLTAAQKRQIVAAWLQSKFQRGG
jgi:hypothetical protein